MTAPQTDRAPQNGPVTDGQPPSANDGAPRNPASGPQNGPTPPQGAPGAEGPPNGSQGGQPDGRESNPANAEAARYRTRARDAEAARDALAARVDRYQRADAERAAADVLANPADLWLFHEPADVLGEDGEVDPARVRDVAAAVAASRPGLAVPHPGHLGGAQGSRGQVSVPEGWADVLRNPQGTSRRSGRGAI